MLLSFLVCRTQSSGSGYRGNRGVSRGNSRGNNYNRDNNRSFRGNSRASGRGGRGGSRGGRGRRAAPPSKDDLDKELDSYIESVCV